MAKGRPAGYSPTRPPSIIRQGLFVQVLGKGFHQTKPRHSENPEGGKVHPNTLVLAIKWTTYSIGRRICTVRALGWVGNKHIYSFWTTLLLSYFGVCPDSCRFAGLSFSGDPIDGSSEFRPPSRTRLINSKPRRQRPHVYKIRNYNNIVSAPPFVWFERGTVKKRCRFKSFFRTSFPNYQNTR